MSEIELMPCPYCGSTNVSTYITDLGVEVAYCEDCGAEYDDIDMTWLY